MNALRSQPEELSRQEMQFKTFEASESTLLPEKEKSSEEKHEDTLSSIYAIGPCANVYSGNF